jgi:hypothetical protein
MDTKEQTKREPLLSAKDAEELARQSYPETYTVNSPPDFGCWVDGLNAAMHFYEAKITSGELRVMNTCTYDRSGCTTCHNVDDHGQQWLGWNYCPGCGAKIVKP